MLQQIDEKLRVRAWEDQLHQFIADLLKNFVDLVESFRNLTDNSKENSPYRRLFSFLGLSATVYPLIIALETEDIIDDRLLTAIEALDLRVYKVRGTNLRAKLYKEIISKIKQKADPTEYLDSIDRLGNLTLLEERINKRIGNRIPDAKAPDYQQSRVPGTKKLGLNIVEEIIERRLW